MFTNFQYVIIHKHSVCNHRHKHAHTHTHTYMNRSMGSPKTECLRLLIASKGNNTNIWGTSSM